MNDFNDAKLSHPVDLDTSDCIQGQVKGSGFRFLWSNHVSGESG